MAADTTFGSLLREYRVAAGLTQEGLAERAAMSASGIRALERGQRRAPRFSTVKLLVDALHLSSTQRDALEAAARHASVPVAAVPDVHRERAAPRTNLPLPLTSFEGRDRELQLLCDLIPERRLITLCGPGGIGKTRLAIETARTIAQKTPERFPDGVWLVEFGSLAESAAVAAQIAMALDVDDELGVLPLDALVGTLRHKRLLLVLDNCEHLIEDVAAVAHRLTTGCPGVHLVATSREPLRMTGERLERLGPLSLPVTRDGAVPSVKELRASPAVRLFLDRSADSAPELSVNLEDVEARRAVVALAHRLEGVPLAIELAAARMSSMTLRALVQRLDDRLLVLAARSRTASLRHHTLRATLDWSYGLLTEHEQRLFDRLGVFADGWTLDALEHVGSDGDIDAEDVLELLSSLVDKSLVVVETSNASEPHYRLLEMTRAYALERLEKRQSRRDPVENVYHRALNTQAASAQLFYQ